LSGDVLCGHVYTTAGRKTRTIEQIINHPREAEIFVSQGKSTREVARQIARNLTDCGDGFLNGDRILIPG